LQAVTAAWREAVGPDTLITVGHLRKRALGHKGLETALLNVAANKAGDAIEPMRLGRWLGRYKGRTTPSGTIRNWWDAHACQQTWVLRGGQKTELDLRP